jgi:hypothetical protein
MSQKVINVPLFTCTQQFEKEGGGSMISLLRSGVIIIHRFATIVLFEVLELTLISELILSTIR